MQVGSAEADALEVTISRSDAAHLLRRTGFGVTSAALDELTRMPNRAAAVLRVTDVSRDPSIADLPVSNAKQPDEWKALSELTMWWLDRMRTSPVPIVEKLVLFWHDHFVSSLLKVGDTGLIAQQHRTLRAGALGDFHALAQAVAVDPAMLFYLDNWVNLAWAPQENFGRELMELFTLGAGQYTQHDVVTMTKAWTGHTLDPATSYRTHSYVAGVHDQTSNVLFGTQRVWDGPAALAEVVTGATAERCSRFITAKLFSLLAYPVGPDDAVVAPLASGFRSSGLDVLELVRSILRSTAFWSGAARGGRVRSPIEWMVAAMQALDLTAVESVSTSWLDRVGQVPFMHPDVNGWVSGEDWLSTATGWGKQTFAAGIRYPLLGRGFLSELTSMGADDAVSAAAARFGIVELSPNTRQVLLDLYARSKAGGYLQAIGVNMAAVLLLSPEFQVV